MRTTGPDQPAQFLLDVVDVLIECGVPYALVGALAASYYGIPRSTTDADALIWLGRAGMNGQDLVTRFEGVGYRAQLNRADIDDPVLGAIIVKDEHENTVDLLFGVRHSDPDAVQRCVSAPLLDSSIRIIAAEDLIPMKIFAGGFQDLEDVKGILQVSGKLLNLDLLRRIASRYGPDIVRNLEDLLKEFPPSLMGGRK